MICNVCGYTGEDFTCSGMGHLCCPSCGAERPKIKVPAASAEDDYAEQLRKVRQDAVADLERQAQERNAKAEYANQIRQEAEARHRQKEQNKKRRNRRERLAACIVPVGIIIFTIFLLRDPASKGFGFAGFLIIVACISAIMGALLKRK